MVDYTEGSGKQYHTGIGPEDIGKYVIPSAVPRSLNILRMRIWWQIVENLLHTQECWMGKKSV